MSYYENYCMECDWSASKRNHSTNELAALAIDHAVSTGHDIDSRDDSDDSGGFEIEAGGTGSEGVVSSLEHSDSDDRREQEQRQPHDSFSVHEHRQRR